MRKYRQWPYRLSIFFLILLVGGAIAPQLFTPHAFDEQHTFQLLQTPSSQFLLGSDELGRDLLSRLLYGARVSLSCALLATFISALIGIFYGTLSVFSGEWGDHFFMRIVDILLSVPDLLIYIILGLFLGRDFWGLLMAISSLAWVDVARITRGEILKCRNMPFVEGAQSLGGGKLRILVYHILPQARDAIMVALLFKIPSVILAESTLSFIGLGLKPPYSSWGTLASEGYGALQFYPHLILFPSLFIFLTIFSFQTIGQRLSEGE